MISPVEIRDVTALPSGQSLPAATHPRHAVSPGTLTPLPHSAPVRQRYDFSAFHPPHRRCFQAEFPACLLCAPFLL